MSTTTVDSRRPRVERVALGLIAVLMLVLRP